MAATATSRVIRSPGRLVVNPQDSFGSNAVAFPYGGTEVGKVNLVVLQPIGTGLRIESEAGYTTDILESAERWVMSCLLRGWDNDALRYLRPEFWSEGDETQHAVVTVPGSQRPGASATSRAVKLALIPDDPVHNPGFILYRAVPDWSDGAEFAFQRQAELGIPMVFECIREHPSARVLQIGRIADLEL